MLLDRFEYAAAYELGDLWHDAVTQSAKLVHAVGYSGGNSGDSSSRSHQPGGKPINHVTHSGFRLIGIGYQLDYISSPSPAAGGTNIPRYHARGKFASIQRTAQLLSSMARTSCISGG